MKKLLIITLFVLGVFVLFFSSCKNTSQPMAFITNMTNVPITLYTDRDSIFLSPLQRTYMADIDVENGQIVSCSGLNWIFSVCNPLTKINVLDTIYHIPEQYTLILKDINNYQHTISTSSSSSGAKYLEDNYNYYLRADLIKKIINASDEN